MRKLIVLCVVLCAVTITSVSTAAYTYWTQRGTTYTCEGYQKGVVCDDLKSPYAISITPTFIAISMKRTNKGVFFCYRNYKNDCFDG